MSALLDGLLGSIVASPTENSEMSGSFQSGFGGGDYDYGGSGIDRNDHYGGHSGHGHGGYHDDKCCPLVVDALCLVAILGAVAGAATFLARTFQIELCNLAGQGVNNCVGRRRKKREIQVPYNVNDWGSAGFYRRIRRAIEGKHLITSQEF